MRKSLFLSLAIAATALCAEGAPGDVVINVNQSMGVRSKSENWTAATQSWFSRWKSTPTESGIPVISLIQANTTNPRINYDNANVLSLQANKVSDAEATLNLQIEGENYGYYISGISFNAVSNNMGAVVNGVACPAGVSTPISATFDATATEHQIAAVRAGESNSNVQMHDFTVTLSLLDQSGLMEMSLTSGTAYQETSGANIVSLIGNSGNYVKLHSETGNITTNNNKILLHSGAEGSAEFTVSSFHPSYETAWVNFLCTSSEDGAKIVAANGTEISVPANHYVAFSSSNGNFSVKGDDATVEISEIKVTLAESGLVSGVPTESGWYEIISLRMHASDYYDYIGHYLVNQPDEFKQNNTNYYFLGISNYNEEKPATKYIYIEVNGNNRYVKSANGHWMIDRCLTAVDKGASTAFNASDNQTVTIGGYWSGYKPATDLKLMGQSSGHTNNRWGVYHVNVEAEYDVWQVSILNGVSTGDINHRTRVECINTENKGIDKVYDGGAFFITKGTAIDHTDFLFEQVGNNNHPHVTIDNESKTITVDYSTTDITKAEAIAAIADDFRAFMHTLPIYNEDDVVNLIAPAIADAEAVATDIESDAQLTLGQLTAINNAANVAERLATLHPTDGLAVHIKNVATNYFMASGNCIADHLDPASLWIMHVNETTGKIQLQNHKTGKYMQNTTANETSVPVNGTGSGYEFTIRPILSGTKVRSCEIYDSESSGYHYLHGQNNRLLKWNSGANTDGSAWTIILADNDDHSEAIETNLSFKEGASQCHELTITHPTEILHKHSSYGDNMVITITPVTSEGEISLFSTGATLIHSQLTENEDGSITATLEDKLDAGTYKVDIPMGMFKLSNNKLSKSVSASFEVAESGATTGIAEITEAAPAVEMIYDLQGRRLAAPIKGINIINGRKVLIK